MADDTGSAIRSLDIHDIYKLLPHRPPFLMVDRIKDIDGDNFAIGIKNVSANEPHFAGHFPDMPIMPGVLIIEGMAQTAGAICILARGRERPGVVYFMTIDEAKFRKPVTPGVLLDLEASFIQQRARVCKVAGRASVNGETTCEVQFTAMIADG